MKKYLPISLTTVLFLSLLLFSGCGQSGSLYLPQKTTTANKVPAKL